MPTLLIEPRAFNFGTFNNGKANQPLPSGIESHEAELASFQEACHNLCRKLLLLFGIGLEVRTTSQSPSPPSLLFSHRSNEHIRSTLLNFS